ncbi:hypothetical protein C8P63_1186 [Melghirimyces profundicolus]|uniref:Protein kinase domain-containing protein n=1 Tax=Melghirimyces profundicolus TaxID=1242148 RepID=A0A2T6BPW7_9BACL|nr:hypothetical protein [Melghirimyces profundicolus]PTX58133.1 hypothetical protein C8P63_1186 [Melghirimyces profundicolus]
MKKKGDRIRGTYRVLQAFPFVQGVLYYTEVEPDSRDGKPSTPLPTRFLHGLDIRSIRKRVDLKKLLKRDTGVFFPLQGLFVEEGILYQVLGKLDGQLLAHHLYRSVPLTANEAIHILQCVSGHLVRIYRKDLFTVVHPQNMLITGGSVRFLYGGPSGLLPKLKGGPPGGGRAVPEERKRQEQMMDAYSLGALAYIMLTGTSPSPPGNLLPIRTCRRDVPPSLEHLIMQSLLAEPESRPRVEDLWETLRRIPVDRELKKEHPICHPSADRKRSPRTPGQVNRLQRSGRGVPVVSRPDDSP